MQNPRRTAAVPLFRAAKSREWNFTFRIGRPARPRGLSPKRWLKTQFLPRNP